MVQRTFLEGKLGRKLPDVDLPAWLSYLALDAGLREQENEVEVLLVHTPAADVLKCCEPSDVNKLNHQACRTPLGEFTFSSVTSSGLVSTEALFLDLMNLALDSADVKCLMLLPFHQVYGNGVEEKSCRIAAYFFIHFPFYEKFNDVLRRRYRKSFAQILIVRSEKLSFSVSLEWETEMSNISLTVPFSFYS